jgi:hypothetical protein
MIPPATCSLVYADDLLPAHQAASRVSKELQINASLSAPGMPLKAATVARRREKVDGTQIDTRDHHSIHAINALAARCQHRSPPFRARRAKLPLLWNASCDYLAGL